MRIGIYARVSTKDQSCEMQLRDLRTYCAARGLDLVREYIDVGNPVQRIHALNSINSWTMLGSDSSK